MDSLCFDFILLHIKQKWTRDDFSSLILEKNKQNKSDILLYTEEQKPYLQYALKK